MISALRELCARNDRADFYKIRGEMPASLAARAARMIFLNKTCFNGLGRGNAQGEFNVPFGDNAGATILDDELLRAVSFALKQTTVVEDDFERIARWARPGDAVYFDPPYYPLTRTANFTAYDRDRFGDAEHARLAHTMRELGRRKVFALLSNSDCPVTRGLYQRLDIDTVQASRRINRDASRRGKVSELLVRNRVR